MRIQLPFALLFAAVFACTMHAEPALAQMHVFLSARGSDSNLCSFTSPCRSFQHAHDVVAPNGEINVLDPAGYGPLTINKSVSIHGYSVAAISMPSGVSGVIIKAPGAAVTLNGLIIDGAGVGATGILLNAGSSLTIQNCFIRNLLGNGIDIEPSLSQAGTFISVSKTTISNNRSGNAIYIKPTGQGRVQATVNLSELNGNSRGLFLDGTSAASNATIIATVAESVSADNSNEGFKAISSPGAGSATIMLFHSVSADNAIGVNAVSAVVRLANSMLTGNGEAWLASSGGSVLSYTDNYIDGNSGAETAPPSISRK
jgi:hypothetical protein